jgi:hypothetical protein
MRARLLPCPACNRHSRVDDTRCPFCSTELGVRVAPYAPPSSVTARMSRSARVALGAALAAMGTAGCGGAPAEPTAPEPITSPPDDTQPQQPDPGAVAPMYGVPAEPPPPDDDGAGAPEYGAPAPE